MDLSMFRRMVVVSSVLAAVWLGSNVAGGDFFLAGVIIVVLTLLIAARFARVPPDVMVGGLAFVGYLVGNRGFAQLNFPGVPLLPGEATLGLALVLLIWRLVWTKTLLLERDSLNALLLFWMVVCAARLPYDLKQNGFVALRDFALVYYALFFFIVQAWAQIPEWRRYVERCLSFGFALTGPIAVLFELRPELFTAVTFSGVPLIFVKGDIAGAYMAAGAFWFISRYRQGNRWANLGCTAVCVAGILFSNSRAATVALAVGAVALVLLRERKIVKALMGLGVLAAFLLMLESALPRTSARPSRVYRVYESMLSIADFSGSRTLTTSALGDKADNNRFRLVWWEAVLTHTREEAPLLGLGFGHDLAAEFLRRYYADNSDDFSTRSPHNFLITVFARTGAVGFICFLGVLGAAAIRTWRTAKVHADRGCGALWVAPWTIVITACFGVILEGPMGAIIFWSLLGLANTAVPPPDSAKIAPAVDAHLPQSEQARELGVPTS